MKTDRRNFLKTAAFAGAGALSVNSINSCKQPEGESNLRHIKEAAGRRYSQQFNMCGYRAPAIETVRVGFIGLGSRGSGAVRRMMNIEGTEVRALCDKRPAAVNSSLEDVIEYGFPAAETYSDDENIWKELCQRDDIDLVYICTPWSLHTPMAVYAMEHGKHVACEIPAAVSIDEAWQLVETSERTKKHCMQLENCCYDFFELLTLNMARQGLFGDIVHGEGAYIHDLTGFNFDMYDNEVPTGSGYIDMWRLKQNYGRKGNLYPTHGLGPVCQVMNINRGDSMDYLTSMSTNDFTMQKMAVEMAEEESFFDAYTEDRYRGNMNTSLIRTNKGRTIMVQHDVSSPRPYSRIHLISGTKGIARKWPSPARIALGHSWLKKEAFDELSERYEPEITRRVGEMARLVGGHGGMDFIMDWRLIDCLRNGLPLDQDVYDAALWSVIAPLSEWSVANRSDSIDVPDFTCGAWKVNSPHDINLEEGGTTGMRNPEKADASMQLNI
ncbi:MAG: Gfo/Idh/MocA family protein [Bacteroidales bacterium]